MSVSNLLNQTITHYTRSSYDRYGDEVDSAEGTEYKARFQKVSKLLKVQSGSSQLNSSEVVTIEGIVYLNGEVSSIVIDDRIDYGGVKYRVFDVKTGVDGQGNIHHTRLTLRKYGD